MSSGAFSSLVPVPYKGRMRLLLASGLALLSFSFPFVGCSSSSTTTTPSDAAPPSDAASSDSSQGAGAVAVGSGSITGVPFSLASVTLHDPGPFNGKARLEIALVDSPACGRAAHTCATYQELWLRVSSAAIVPGTYSVILGDAGEVGGLEARLETSTASASSCNLNDDPVHAGTVTIDSVSATEAKGSFEVDVENASTPDHVTGTFDAKPCP